MDLLLAILIVTYVIKNAITDTAYAVRGQTPPRLRIKWEKQRHRTAGTKAPARYGMTGYVRDLWHDSWEDARTHREAKRAQRDADTNTADPSAEPDEIPGPGTGDVPEIPAAPTAALDSTQQEPATPPAPNQKPAASLAVVTPIRPDQKGDRVNTANPETTTLSAAKAYAHQMAGAATQASASVEQTRAHLTANQVGGDALARLAEAQELAGQLAIKFKAAYDELAKHDTVKDAYQAVPDAGSKEFVTQE